NHELLRGVVVVVQQHLVQGWPLGLGLLQRPKLAFRLGPRVEIPVLIVRTFGHAPDRILAHSDAVTRPAHQRPAMRPRAHTAASRTTGLGSAVRRSTTGRAAAFRPAPSASKALRRRPSYCARASALPAARRSNWSRVSAASSAGASPLIGRGANRGSAGGTSA